MVTTDNAQTTQQMVQGIDTTEISLSIFDACVALASRCELKPSYLPNTFSERSASRADISLQMRSFAWHAPGVRQFRLTEITGAAGTYMANVGVLPQPESVLPLMQLELLVVKERLFLFIADVLPLPPEIWALPTIDPHKYLRQLAAAHPELPSTLERPEWSKAVISESAIWSRPNQVEAVAPAHTACQSFLEWCGQIIQAGAGQSVSGAIADARRDLLRHFREVFLEHEPSRPYLGSMFGKDWAERYMSDFLFVDIDTNEPYETQSIDRPPL